MHHERNIDIANKIGTEAFARLQKDGIALDPKNFEVFYAYQANSHAELKKAMDSLIKTKGKLTSEDCHAFHEEFLSEKKKKEAYDKASNQIHATLEDVSGLMDNVREATTGYTKSLVGASKKISAISTPEEMQHILKTVVADTNRILEHNKQLEAQLDKSAYAIQELKTDLEKIQREAMTDGLTSLANRKSFDNQLESLRKSCTESGKIFTLLIMDIDHFKTFNDNFGHQVGDQVLRLVARTLTDGIKGKDMAARYGGEEFVILLPETNLNHGMMVAESLRKSLANKEIINRANGELLGRITMSVGVAQFYADEAKEDFISRADAALYTAKHNGRNQVAAAPTPYDQSISNKI